ncbi:uncharacterized protein PADG_12061 [Paracoccidioides brasiliensis Pb18]|uniref:Uncharacterized protein n=1 Tax=Paracoccidioides brasiliensis (strain Pb18) TaxID=502780 RepID=A0A0A0HWJ5_PARBD|nr:uncharacterized protein PADG_12061 [Paracoccidioides brasiliensis Pb18]KGM91755.1 hypothetical protein PADG_12061 [Paracoccidioides brasiliensis Pb18]
MRDTIPLGIAVLAIFLDASFWYLDVVPFLTMIQPYRYRALCANQALITNVGFVGAAQYSSIQTGIIQRAILTESKQGASSSNLVMAHRLGSLTFAVECLEIKPALPLLSSQRGSKNSNEISLLYILPECDMYDVDKTESSDNKEFSA